jgi:predicted PurR-regulated permease PerM
MSTEDPMQTPALEHRFLLWLVVGMSLAFGLVLWPYLGAVLWALFIAIVFQPVQHRMMGRTGRRGSLAALLSLLVILVIVILPVILVAMSVAQQVSEVAQMVRSGELDVFASVQKAIEGLPAWARGLLGRFGIFDVTGLQRQLGAFITTSGQFITTHALGLGQITIDFVVALFVMLYLLYFMLRDGEMLVTRLMRAVPLESQHTERLLTQFATVVRATVKGNVVIAIVQGSLGGAAFAFLGLPGALLWGTLMTLLSLLPAVGAALVWAPVAVWLFATGQVGAAAGLTAWGVLVIGLIDNVLRPILVGKDTRLPDYLVLLATLGGISAFGLNGFVIGPVIAAMFLVAWDLFTVVRQQAGTAPPPA